MYSPLDKLKSDKRNKEIAERKNETGETQVYPTRNTLDGYIDLGEKGDKIFAEEMGQLVSSVLMDTIKSFDINKKYPKTHHKKCNSTNFICGMYLPTRPKKEAKGKAMAKALEKEIAKALFKGTDTKNETKNETMRDKMKQNKVEIGEKYYRKLPDLQAESWRIAEAKGWHEEERSIGEILALIHSEVSEALEAYRNDNQELYKEELADIVIRILDHCETNHIDLTYQINRKNQINADREYRHGGKKL